MGRILHKLLTSIRVLVSGKRNHGDVAWLARRPQLAAVIGLHEGALLTTTIDGRLTSLASLRAASRVGCPF